VACPVYFVIITCIIYFKYIVFYGDGYVLIQKNVNVVYRCKKKSTAFPTVYRLY
jgi:hypothetical protein